MEFIHNWIVGICAASILYAAVHSLAPEGAAKRAVRLAGGACVLIAVCAPIAKADLSGLALEAGELSDEYAAEAERMERERFEFMKSVIEEKAKAYILDKADELGVACDVDVMCSDEEGVPVPVSLHGVWSGDEDARERLADAVARDLGIPRASQSWGADGG